MMTVLLESLQEKWRIPESGLVLFIRRYDQGVVSVERRDGSLQERLSLPCCRFCDVARRLGRGAAVRTLLRAGAGGQ